MSNTSIKGQIREKIADSNLQSALDANVEWRMACRPASAIISGPSRTADIEMTLTIGVHGPKELVVFLLL